MKLRIVLGIVATLGCLGAATAAPVTFFAAGSFDDGTALGGTLTIDTALGTVTASTLTAGAASFTNVVDQGDADAPLFYSVFARNAAGTEDFDFGLPLHSLVGYAGGAICSNATPDCTPSNLFDLVTNTPGATLATGTLSTSPVPEPSTAALLLLGAFAAGIGAAARRLVPPTGIEPVSAA